MKYIVTDMFEGAVRQCSEQEAQDMRYCEDFFVVKIDYNTQTSYWLTFDDEVSLND